MGPAIFLIVGTTVAALAIRAFFLVFDALGKLWLNVWLGVTAIVGAVFAAVSMTNGMQESWVDLWCIVALSPVIVGSILYTALARFPDTHEKISKAGIRKAFFRF